MGCLTQRPPFFFWFFLFLFSLCSSPNFSAYHFYFSSHGHVLTHIHSLGALIPLPSDKPVSQSVLLQSIFLFALSTVK